LSCSLFLLFLFFSGSRPPIIMPGHACRRLLPTETQSGHPICRVPRGDQAHLQIPFSILAAGIELSLLRTLGAIAPPGGLEENSLSPKVRMYGWKRPSNHIRSQIQKAP
jgi:hypothetical protein